MPQSIPGYHSPMDGNPAQQGGRRIAKAPDTAGFVANQLDAAKERNAGRDAFAASQMAKVPGGPAKNTYGAIPGVPGSGGLKPISQEFSNKNLNGKQFSSPSRGVANLIGRMRTSNRINKLFRK